jgi:hypothetical protein
LKKAYESYKKRMAVTDLYEFSRLSQGLKTVFFIRFSYDPYAFFSHRDCIFG